MEEKCAQAINTARTFPQEWMKFFKPVCKQYQCGFRIAGSDPEAGQIEARSKMSMRSWGEKITITTSAAGRADIKSTCYWIQTVDWGKNKANVNALFSALRQLLPPQPQQ
jgi:hypothetical protein